MALSIEQTKKICELACLKISDDDLPQATQDLNAIVDCFEILGQADVEGIEPLVHPIPLFNVFRDDVPSPSLSQAMALANAPVRTGDYFGVPAVFNDD